MLEKMIEILLNERDFQTSIPRGNLSPPEYFRALCNIRPPLPVTDEFLTLQDQYLEQETMTRGVVRTADLEVHDQVSLWQGDITRLDCDAIVNAGNSALLGCFQPLHNCIDNVIHSWSGVQVRLECEQIMKGQQLPNGEVVSTPAYNLPGKFIFHTVGPIVRSDHPSTQHIADLKNCYLNSLNLAQEMGLQSIAFCCISTGVYGYPQDQAAELAVSTVRDWIINNDGIKVIFNVFLDKDRLLYEYELSR